MHVVVRHTSAGVLFERPFEAPALPEVGHRLSPQFSGRDDGRTFAVGSVEWTVRDGRDGSGAVLVPVVVLI